MKKNKTLPLPMAIIIGSFFAIILFGCTSDKEDTFVPRAVFQQEGAEIHTLTFNYEEENTSVDILSNEDWTLTNDADWVDLGYSSGRASDEPFRLTIKVKKNTRETARQTVVTLQTAQNKKSLTLIQEGEPVSPLEWESAIEAVRHMKTGWNLGNTLDACGDWITQWNAYSPAVFETAWGQPLTRPELMRFLAEAGFGAIRVPVTWYPHMDATSHKVNAAWMNRVEEVVNYVLDAGMYCVLNVHHDTGTDGWIMADPMVYNRVNEKYKTLWAQIAERFKTYDHRLIFEGYNEMLDSKDSWNVPQVEGAYHTVNAYMQDFVTTVRETGGNNRKRNLVLTTYSACPDNFAEFKLPTDLHPGHLIAEVHSYAPYVFAFDVSESPYFTDETVFTAAAEQEIRQVVQSLNEHWVSKGIPCIIGEYGAADKNNTAERAKQVACYVSEAAKYNICCFHWMGIINGDDRANLEWTEPEIRDAILDVFR